MLSKSKGQVLRIAAALHVLFHIKIKDSKETDTQDNYDGENGEQEIEEQEIDQGNGEQEIDQGNGDLEVPSMISESAIKAAINFVSLCCQQTAYMTGRDNIKEEVKILNTSMHIAC